MEKLFRGRILRGFIWKAACLSGGVLVLALLFTKFFTISSPVRADAADWSTYLNGNAHTGYNATETVINQTSAPGLRLHWTAPAGTRVFSQPVVANGMIYWGSWDGFEHASTLNGTQVWKQFVGISNTLCGALSTDGQVGTTTVAPVSINGTMTEVAFVPGGDANLYALNALTGAIIWQLPLGGPGSNIFLWDSPSVFNGSVYIGTASLGDCPLIQSQVVRVDAASGVLQNTFNIVPPGCIGGSLWGSLTIDEAAGTLYFATGNGTRCKPPERNAEALVELRASDLSFISSWQLPKAESVNDGDFGSTPTLFQSTINGTVVQMVGLPNKNGIYYAFDRSAIGNGPLWRATIAVGGTCPQCGKGSISPSAWDGATLYVAGGNTTINSIACRGSLRALNPATGAFLWEDCFPDGPVLAAVTVVPDVAMVIEGQFLALVHAGSGQVLYKSSVSNSKLRFYGAISVSNGVLYVGSKNQGLYALGL